jgi:hypothetical protein
MDLAESMFIRKVFLKRDARRFKEKCPHSPSCESTWQLQRHLVQLLAIWRQSANAAHSSVSGLLCSIVSNGAMNEFGICFQWPNEHFNPRMLLFSEGNGAMKAPRNWQRRNECSTMVATARWDQCEFTSRWKVSPIHSARWIFIATYRWNLKLHCKIRFSTSRRPGTGMSPNLCSKKFATTQWWQLRYETSANTHLWKSKCPLSIRRDEFSLSRISET